MIQHHKHLSLELLLPDGLLCSSPGTDPAREARRNSRTRRVVRRARSADVLDGMERGQAGPERLPQQIMVDGRPALVRLGATGIEWSSHGSTESVPFDEMLSARQAAHRTRTWLPCLRAPPVLHRLEMFTFRRTPRRRCEWAPRTVVMEAAEEEVIQDWASAINAGIEAASAGRPKSLLVLLNPNSGYRQARRLYRCIVAPTFAAAGIEAAVWETHRAGHACELVARLTDEQVASIDGIVCVGGDGIFHEALNGLLQARGAAAAAGAAELTAALAALRLAHIPAGSTDAVACTLHGTRSAFVAAMHCCLGDSTPLDVLRVDGASGTKFASCIAAYGFLADVTLAAEQYRWMGPLRYDLVGTAKLLASRAYPACVRYLEGEVGQALSKQPHAVCGAGCFICRTASFMHCRRWSQQQMAAPHTPAGSTLASPTASGSTAIAGRGSSSLSCTGTSEAHLLPHPASTATSEPSSGPDLHPTSGAGPSSSSPSVSQHHFLQHAAGAAERQGGEGEQWQEVEGTFASIMLIVMPCRSDKTRRGMARHAHLADGRLKLVLVRKCSPLQYLRFLLSMSRSGCAPGQLPYVEVLDAVAVQVQPGDGSALSAWNLDGECSRGGDMHMAAEVHNGLLRVFARGVE